MDKLQKTGIIALSVTIAAVFALFWFINIISEPKLNVSRFENQSCSCSSSSNCPYSQSCHRLLGTHKSWSRYEKSEFRPSKLFDIVMLCSNWINEILKNMRDILIMDLSGHYLAMNSRLFSSFKIGSKRVLLPSRQTNTISITIIILSLFRPYLKSILDMRIHYSI